MSVKYIISLALVVTLIIASPALIFADSNQNGSNECKPAGSTGLTAFMIVHSNKVVTGMTINANGCDIGIYVPPGSKNVVMNPVRIFHVYWHCRCYHDLSLHFCFLEERRYRYRSRLRLWSFRLQPCCYELS